MLIMISVFKSDEVSNFLNTRELSKALIEAIVNMIPDREFYYPEINGTYIRTIRTDMSELRQKARQSMDEYSVMNYEYLRKEYEDEIDYLVIVKRKLLVFGILMQSNGGRRDILYRMIKSYRLQKRVLALQEVFRE